MKPKYENLLKVTKKHLHHCKMFEFSLRVDRRCTCGVEKAREELYELLSWKSAVEEACIVNWVEVTTPEETIAELINRNVAEALDPQISSMAVDLIQKHGGKYQP
jgi:hypothetical protein